MRELDIKDNEVKFSCLDCESILDRAGDQFICPSCSRTYPIRDGIPSFVKEDFYWGNLLQEDMQELIGRMKSQNWQEALNDQIKNDKQGKLKSLEPYIFDNQRAAWQFFFPLNKNSKVLDIGSLWGTLPFQLAKQCKTVIAVDAVIENCKFMNIRKQQDDVSNIQVVCANATDIPFPDESFDLVILNGVLEWTGLADPQLNPLHIHRQILAKIHKMLKKGGQLYIGIENRFGADCLLGAKDPHTGLRFITVLPRIIADYYSHTKRGRRYSEITHSYWGLKKILKQCHFDKVDFYMPLPNYRHFSYLIPFNSNNTLRYSVKTFMQSQIINGSGRIKAFFFIVKIFITLRLCYFLKRFAPSFSVFAKKND